MWIRKLFDSLKPVRSRTPVRPAPCRLSVEALDGRIVPASLTVGNVSLIEGNAGTQNALVSVRLSAPSAQTVTVNYNTGDGTASAGSDYQSVSGKLTISPGQTSTSILVPVFGDRLGEPNETIFVNLRAAKNATIADGRGVVSTVDDDPRLSINSVALPEQNSGETPFVFTVSLSAACAEPVTVNWATADGSATAGSDYQAASGTLTIPAGQTTGTITVLVNGDRLAEPNEAFTINLRNPVNAGIAAGHGVGTVVDDEPRLSIINVSLPEQNEGAIPFVFTVSLSAAYDEPVTVNWATSDASATIADNDYVADSGTLTFAPGETSKTITVWVLGDTTIEGDEIFFVNLSGATNASLPSPGFGTILEDDGLWWDPSCQFYDCS